MPPKQLPFTYQYEDWIGGHGCVLKHIVLMAVIQSCQKIHRQNGVMVIDCMAGDGVYDLNQHSQPLAYQKGVLQVMVQAIADPTNAPNIVQQYVTLLMKITGCHSPDELDVFPGSPIIVQNLLRPQIDEHRLLNNHSDDIQWLQLDGGNGGTYATTSVRNTLDAYDIENSMEYILPYTDTPTNGNNSHSNRGKHPIIFIDPDYANESDYGNTKKLLSTILDQCSHATVIVSVPFIHNSKYRYTYINGLRDVAKQHCSTGRYYCNIIIAKDNYIGDAVLVCNPTNDLDDETYVNDHTLHWLANVMNMGKDEYTIEQIMKKKKA